MAVALWVGLGLAAALLRSLHLLALELTVRLIVRVDHMGGLFADLRVLLHGGRGDVARVDGRLHEVRVADVRVGSGDGGGRLRSSRLLGGQLAGILVGVGAEEEACGQSNEGSGVHV